MMRKQFGGKASKSDLEKYARSNNWDGKKFVNLQTTNMNFSFSSLPKLLYKQFCEKEGREPKTKLPILPFEQAEFLKPSNETKFIWYGHSALLMRMNHQTILIDPMLGPNAAPISPFSVNRFSDNTLELAEDFPEINLLLLTHDHYDHLDYESIQRLKPKVKKYFVALGVARHLIQWGIPSEDITEFDWWEHKTFAGIQIHFTPSRHFSGRGLADRAMTLWGGWVFQNGAENLWYSGDGGYGDHFKKIGDKLGPFDFAFIECGQYNENWHQIHMYPEESVQAGIDAQAQIIMPVHWGSFSLAQHSWTEPVERFIAESERRNIRYLTPQKGRLVSMQELPVPIRWWD